MAILDSAQSRSTSIRPQPSNGIGNSTFKRNLPAVAAKDAQYNLDNCRVHAPFDARTWWAVANFREGQLEHIKPGMRADVYVMSKPNLRLSGVVDSVGFGVTPDADLIGRLAPGLPDVQRTLN
jgi:multidrug efflux system membrane fusion protein